MAQVLKKISALTLAAFFIAAMFPANAAAATFSKNFRATYLTILYNNSNGLPTSEANAIVQSENGFIYIGSYSGLVRYDGVNFTRFDSSTGITSVVSLFADSEDRLWIGTNDSGIALYEDGEFTFFNRESGLSALSVRSITEDNAGNIIIATTSGLAYIDAQKSLHMINDPVVNGKYLKQVTSGNDGAVYGCTLDGTVFRMESLKVTHAFSGSELGISTATCVTPDPYYGGVVWVGTEESEVIRGSFSDNMESRSAYSIAPNVTVNSICAADSGTFRVCTDNGIGIMDEFGNYISMSDLPMNNSVENMITDYEGNLWFVSSRQGVMKIIHNRFTDVSKAAGLDSLVVNTTCVYDDELYIGTDSGLIVVDRGDYRKTRSTLTEMLNGVRIRSIKADSQNRLWICTYGEHGLLCVDNGSIISYNADNGLKSDRVRTMTELSDGTVAAATSGGPALIKDGAVIRTMGESDGIGNLEILCVCEGDNGKLYLGSDGGGIYIVENGRVTEHLGLDEGLRSEIILRIKEDPVRGGYWIITGNSLAYMENEEVRTLANFPYSNNFDVFFNKDDIIWVLCSSGIYATSAEKLLAGEALEYSFYDVKCGLPSVATANSRSCLSDDGILYIAGMTGVSAININKQHVGGAKIKMSVPFVEIDDKPVAVKDGETVIIPADCKRLTIYGYALTFGLSNPRLSYTLEGFDTESVTVAREELQPVSYTNLDHGEYVFRFSMIDTMTGRETDSISVRFFKEKAFFEEIWFWLLMALAAAAVCLTVLLLYTRAKNHLLLKKQEEDQIFLGQIIKAFAKCIDLKDTYTNGHSFRVAKYSAMIARRMGYSNPEIMEVYNIGLLHDIGKIAVPDKILGKPDRLTDEEFEIISHHAENGYEILKEIEIRPELAVGAGYHHEHYDGSGYPFGKKGSEIPEVAQIIAVADTFDAMNSTRPYRKQLAIEIIVNEMKRIAGTQLNPDIVKIFLDIVEEGRLDDPIPEESRRPNTAED